MEKQEFIWQRRRCCLGFDWTICFLAFVPELIFGLIHRAFFYETIRPAIASAIGFVAIVAVMIVVLLIAQIRRGV